MKKKLTRVQYRRRKRMKRLLILSVLLLLMVTGIGMLGSGVNHMVKGLFFQQKGKPTMKMIDGFYESLGVQEMLLTPNVYSRPQTALNKVNSVVIHYTANPGTDAKANRNYFEGLKDGVTYSSGKYIYASSNYIIGLEGNIVQCIPLNEVAYASNDRNNDSLSIECCHPDETGKFTGDTYEALVNLTAWICSEYNLSKNDIIRHYDVSGKICPKYFVENEDAWVQFKEDVFKKISDNARK